MALANGPKLRESQRQSQFMAPGGGKMASADNRTYVESAMAGLLAMPLASLAALLESKFLSLRQS